MKNFSRYVCSACHCAGSTAGSTCDHCGTELLPEDFTDDSAKALLDAQLEAVTGKAPEAKRLLDEALAKATEKPKPYHQGCLACNDMGYIDGAECSECNGTGGY